MGLLLGIGCLRILAKTISMRSGLFCKWDNMRSGLFCKWDRWSMRCFSKGTFKIFKTFLTSNQMPCLVSSIASGPYIRHFSNSSNIKQSCSYSLQPQHNCLNLLSMTGAITLAQIISTRRSAFIYLTHSY